MFKEEGAPENIRIKQYRDYAIQSTIIILECTIDDIEYETHLMISDRDLRDNIPPHII